MKRSFLTDEHIPNVFENALSSSGYGVVDVRTALEPTTPDRDVLRFAARNGRILVTNDQSDFSGPLSDEISHAGVVIYTDRNFLSDAPESAVTVIDRVLSQYPPTELENESVWLESRRGNA